MLSSPSKKLKTHKNEGGLEPLNLDELTAFDLNTGTRLTEEQEEENRIAVDRFFSPLLLGDLIQIDKKKLEKKTKKEKIEKKEAPSPHKSSSNLGLELDESTDIESLRSGQTISNLNKRGMPSSSNTIIDDIKQELIKGNISWKDIVIT